MGFFKDAFKEKIGLNIIAGGNQLTDKEIPGGVRKVVLIKGDTRGEVTIQIPFLSKEKYTLTGIEWEEKATRSGGKAAVGAIAGTVIAGPVGTIAGAAVGGRKKDESKAFIYLLDADEQEIALHIECSKSEYSKLSSLCR
ncbi:MAG: hypothetical protein ACK4HV_02900 [Parachlamydiaceae bacterium]